MKESIISFFILLLWVGGSTVKAQIDPHFSQYYAYPLWLNPALTGVVDGEARITGNVREQWSGLSNNYRTAAVSADFRQSDKIALGVNIFSQQAGTAGYNYLAAYGSFAYQLPISPDSYHKLNLGLQAGVINRSFDVSKLQMDDQYNTSTGFDPNMARPKTLPAREMRSLTQTQAYFIMMAHHLLSSISLEVLVWHI